VVVVDPDRPVEGMAMALVEGRGRKCPVGLGSSDKTGWTRVLQAALEARCSVSSSRGILL